MSASPVPRLTPEQYLEIERKAEFKSEYYQGEMFAMAGASYAHVIITGNLVREIGYALKGKHCSVVANDLRVRVSPGGLYTYPDVIVICGPPQFADDQADTLLNPTLIIEVLSKSTEAHDRGFKFEQFRTLDSLQEYALVSQDRPKIEKFGRQSPGAWLFSECTGMDAVCEFESVGCSIPLSEIYHNVTFKA